MHMQYTPRSYGQPFLEAYVRICQIALRNASTNQAADARASPSFRIIQENYFAVIMCFIAVGNLSTTPHMHPYAASTTHSIFLRSIHQFAKQQNVRTMAKDATSIVRTIYAKFASKRLAP